MPEPKQLLDGLKGVATSKKSLWLGGLLGFLTTIPDTSPWVPVAKAIAVGVIGFAYLKAQGDVDKAALVNDPGAPLPPKPPKKGGK